ncbi:MAG: cyclase family protein [Paracoccaceae bacterium]
MTQFAFSSMASGVGAFALAIGLGGMAKADPATDIAAAVAGGEVVDLTVTISENYPAHWPFHPPFRRWTMNWFEKQKGPYTETPLMGAGGKADTVKENLVQSVFPYYSQQFVIDEHTGTQADFPAHFVPPKGSGIEFENASGWLTGDKYPVDRMMGPAVVVDVSSILDKADGGKSPLITVDMIKADEAANGEISAGDVVVFYSGYDDAYYKPFPEGNRLAWDPLVKGNVPGWPAPTPEAVMYLAGKGVTHLAADSPSMGPIGHSWEGKPMAQMTHVKFLETGGSWTEFLRNVGELPARGAYFISLSAKIVDMSGGLTRAIAIKPQGPGVGG